MVVEDESLKLQSMLEYEFETENGVFSATPRVEVISRTKDLVKFRVPYGISGVEITIRKDGRLVTENYEVML